MKAFKMALFLALAIFGYQTYAQTDKASTKRSIEERSFTFVATAAIPLNTSEVSEILSKMPGAAGGANISLAGDQYDVRVRPDSIIVHLPYYGRAFVAPINRDNNAFNFTSVKFDYESEARKKGSWQITIQPKDITEPVRMTFTISTNGYASLVMNSNSRQSITFNGYLKETHPRK